MADEKQVSMIALKTFDHDDGRRLPVDAEFLVRDEAQAIAYEAKGLAKRGGAAKAGTVTPEVETKVATEPSLKELEKGWTLAQDPETYLKSHPDGPNAETAQKIVAAREAAEKSKEK
jgi:hypothetical protein